MFDLDVPRVTGCPAHESLNQAINQIVDNELAHEIDTTSLLLLVQSDTKAARAVVSATNTCCFACQFVLKSCDAFMRRHHVPHDLHFPRQRRDASREFDRRCVSPPTYRVCKVFGRPLCRCTDDKVDIPWNIQIVAIRHQTAEHVSIGIQRI